MYLFVSKLGHISKPCKFNTINIGYKTRLLKKILIHKPSKCIYFSWLNKQILISVIQLGNNHTFERYKKRLA